MGPYFTTLPIDVLLDIYQYLSVVDISRLSRTCKVIRDSTNERSLWIKLYSDLWTLFISPDPSSLSNQALIQRVVRDAVLDAQWRKSSTKASSSRKVYRSRELIECIELLNGGQHLIIVDSNGVLDIISTMPNCPISVHSESTNSCPLTNKPLSYVSLEVIRSSETEGYVFVNEEHDNEMAHLGSSKFVCARHVQVYQYNLSTDTRTSKIVGTTHIILDYNRDIYGWSAFESSFVCLYRYMDDQQEFNDEECFLSFFEEKLTSPSHKLIDARFRLLEFDAYPHSNKDVAIASPRRVIVVFHPCVAIYDFPQQLHYSDSFGNHSVTSVSPIWKWNSPKGFLRCDPRPTLSPIYRRASTPDVGMIHVFEGDRINKIIFSLNGEPSVTKQSIIYGKGKVPRALAVLGLREFWNAGSRGYRTLSNSSITKPSVSGSFEIGIEPGMRICVSRPSVEETTGLISIVVKDKDREFWVLLADVNELQ